eukprot:COSAG01_NODE_18944_length_1042_cov_0.629905_1_plen_32_part_10
MAEERAEALAAVRRGELLEQGGALQLLSTLGR